MIGARLDIPVCATTFSATFFSEATAPQGQLTFDASRADGRALTCFDDDAIQGVIWGDPAYRHEDKYIKHALAQGKGVSPWGRSFFGRCKRTGEWRVGGDRLGAFPVLMMSTSAGVVFASHRQGLLESAMFSARISAAGTLSLMGFGQLMGEQSIVEGTSHLRGGSTVYVEKRGNVSRNDAAPFLLPGKRNASFPQALDAFMGALEKCIESDRYPLVSISGGLDSRLILAGLLKLGIKPDLLCYGAEQSADIVIARDIADKFGLRLYEGLQAPGFDRKAAERIAYAGGGEVAYHHGHALMHSTLLEKTRGRTIITGTGAETFRAFYYDRGMPGYSVLATPLGKNYLRGKAMGYVAQEFAKLLAPLASAFPALTEPLRASLDNVLAPYAESDLDNARMLDSIYLGERVRRMVVAGQQLLDAYYVRTHPFLAQPVIETLAALPVRYKLGSGFHREAIQQLSPSLASIDWDKTSRPLAEGLRWRERYPALAARLGQQAAWGKQGRPLADYPSHVATGCLDTMISALSAQGIAREAAVHGLGILLKGPSATHLRGLSHSLAGLEASMNIRQEACA